MSPLARAGAAARDLPRAVRTLRYLAPRQVLWRLWTAGRFRLYGHVPAVAALGLGRPARPASAALAVLAGWVARKHPGALSERQIMLAAEAAAGRFTFLTRTLDCGGGAVDWRARGMSRLWQYHLHYGEYVAALALGARQTLEPRWAERAWALIDDWIAGNPPGSRPGWEPYPLSLRLVNWATALGALSAAASADGRLERLLPSIAAQGRFLARHLEHHLGGNHLIKNAKALLLLGALVGGAEGERWGRQGRALLQAELARQVLPDGGHVERSPLYHAIVLEDVLDCLALDAAAGPGGILAPDERRELAATAQRMATWLATLLHPDGGFPLFNDCVIAGEPTPAALLAYAERLVGLARGEVGPAAALPDSGYYVLRSGAGRMVIDCGPVGPDELPAHAHADTLSYELVWGTDRVVVDSGTAEYALDDLRRYVRSTRAHNTVVVDGVEQSEVWASHRVGRRARPLGARLVASGDGVTFAGAHDGYARLGVIHHRHVAAVGEAWIVVDELVGSGHHRAESLVHLHPAFRAEADADGRWRLLGGAQRLQLRPLGPVTVTREPAWYCPEWGCALPSTALCLAAEGPAPLAFGYVLAPADLAIEVALAADGAGVTLTGRVGERQLRLRSDRCTSSS